MCKLLFETVSCLFGRTDYSVPPSHACRLASKNVTANILIGRDRFLVRINVILKILNCHFHVVGDGDGYDHLQYDHLYYNHDQDYDSDRES